MFNWFNFGKRPKLPESIADLHQPDAANPNRLSLSISAVMSFLHRIHREWLLKAADVGHTFGIKNMPDTSEQGFSAFEASVIAFYQNLISQLEAAWVGVLTQCQSEFAFIEDELCRHDQNPAAFAAAQSNTVQEERDAALKSTEALSNQILDQLESEKAMHHDELATLRPRKHDLNELLGNDREFGGKIQSKSKWLWAFLLLIFAGEFLFNFSALEVLRIGLIESATISVSFGLALTALSHVTGSFLKQLSNGKAHLVKWIVATGSIGLSLLICYLIGAIRAQYLADSAIHLPVASTLNFSLMNAFLWFAGAIVTFSLSAGDPATATELNTLTDREKMLQSHIQSLEKAISEQKSRLIEQKTTIETEFRKALAGLGDIPAGLRQRSYKCMANHNDLLHTLQGLERQINNSCIETIKTFRVANALRRKKACPAGWQTPLPMLEFRFATHVPLSRRQNTTSPGAPKMPATTGFADQEGPGKKVPFKEASGNHQAVYSAGILPVLTLLLAIGCLNSCKTPDTPPQANIYLLFDRTDSTNNVRIDAQQILQMLQPEKRACNLFVGQITDRPDPAVYTASIPAPELLEGKFNRIDKIAAFAQEANNLLAKATAVGEFGRSRVYAALARACIKLSGLPGEKIILVFSDCLEHNPYGVDFYAAPTNQLPTQFKRFEEIFRKECPMPSPAELGAIDIKIIAPGVTPNLLRQEQAQRFWIGFLGNAGAQVEWGTTLN